MNKKDLEKLKRICDSIRSEDDIASKYAEARNSAMEASRLAYSAHDLIGKALYDAGRNVAPGDIQQVAENFKKEKRIIDAAYEDLEKSLKKAKAFKDFVSSL